MRCLHVALGSFTCALHGSQWGSQEAQQPEMDPADFPYRVLDEAGVESGTLCVKFKGPLKGFFRGSEPRTGSTCSSSARR